MKAREVNRSVVILTAKQPFLEWLRSLDPSSKDLVLAEVNFEPIIYLIRECVADEEFGQWMEQNFDLLFAEQLGGWWQDERSWPANRTLDLFQQWFNCRFYSLVLDCSDELFSVRE